MHLDTVTKQHALLVPCVLRVGPNSTLWDAPVKQVLHVLWCTVRVLYLFVVLQQQLLSNRNWRKAGQSESARVCSIAVENKQSVCLRTSLSVAVQAGSQRSHWLKVHIHTHTQTENAHTRLLNTQWGPSSAASSLPPSLWPCAAWSWSCSASLVSPVHMHVCIHTHTQTSLLKNMLHCFLRDSQVSLRTKYVSA